MQKEANMTAIALARTASLQSSAGQTQVTREEQFNQLIACLLYTSDAADECVNV